MKSLGAPTQASASMKKMGEDLAITDDVVAVYITENAPSLFSDVQYQRLYRRRSDAVAVGPRQIDGGPQRGWTMAYRLASGESTWHARVAAFQRGGPQSLDNDRYCTRKVAQFRPTPSPCVTSFCRPCALGRGRAFSAWHGSFARIGERGDGEMPMGPSDPSSAPPRLRVNHPAEPVLLRWTWGRPAFAKPALAGEGRSLIFACPGPRRGSCPCARPPAPALPAGQSARASR
jgi:hypothetical protein